MTLRELIQDKLPSVWLGAHPLAARWAINHHAALVTVEGMDKPLVLSAEELCLNRIELRELAALGEK